jgi:hypothetical protein
VIVRLPGGSPFDMRRACVSESWIDPGSLEGDALRQWYLRSPADVERERQEAAARRYQDFFHGSAPGNDPDPQFDDEAPASSQGIASGLATSAPSISDGVDPGFTWVADGPNRLRSVRMDGNVRSPTSYGLASYGSPMAGLRWPDHSALGRSP